MKNKKILKQRGFSLIELLIVIVIIAIFTTLTLNTLYKSSRNKGRDAALVSSMSALANYMETKRDLKGNYPYIRTTSGTHFLHLKSHVNYISYEHNQKSFIKDAELRDLMRSFHAVGDLYIFLNGHDVSKYCFSSPLKDGRFILANEEGISYEDTNACI